MLVSNISHPFPFPFELGRRRFGPETDPRPSRVAPDSGRTTGGTALTITGLNFRNLPDGSPPTVTVGGVAATSVVVVDLQTITCVTGSSLVAGLVNVAVTIGTQTGTVYGGFTYYTSTILSVTPTFGTLAGGTTVVIEGFNFLEGSVVLFGTTQATDVVFIDDQHIECVSPAHATGYVDVSIIEPL